MPLRGGRAIAEFAKGKLSVSPKPGRVEFHRPHESKRFQPNRLIELRPLCVGFHVLLFGTGTREELKSCESAMALPGMGGSPLQYGLRRSGPYSSTGDTDLDPSTKEVVFSN